MSSTNVHSNREVDNIYCASAQIVPTEKELGIPPKKINELKELSSLNTYLGEGMEIQVGDSVLSKNGELRDKNGNTIGNIGENGFKQLAAKKVEREHEKEAGDNR